MNSPLSSDGTDDFSTKLQREARISDRNRVKVLRAVQRAGRHRSSPSANVFSSDED